MTASLTLTPTNGTALDLIGGAIKLARDVSVDSFLPVPSFDEVYAESVDTEGGKLISSRPNNPISQGKVYITGTSASDFWTNAKSWQQCVAAVTRYGGTFIYTPQGGTQVTYDIQSIRITSFPQDSILINRLSNESEFEVTLLPYGRLASQTFYSAFASAHPIFGVDIGDRAYATVIAADTPSMYWRLGVSGTTDQSGNARNGTAGGGVTIGGVAGALSNDTDTATTFDGVDDRVTSSYAGWADSAVRGFECWAYRSASGSDNAIFAGDGGAASPSLKILAGSTDVRLRIRDNDSGATSSTTWSSAWPGNSVWTHTFLIWDTTNDVMELWINGVSQGIKTGLTQSLSTAGNVLLGAFGSTFTQPFNGRIDEAAVYEARLTGERIIAHYAAGSSRLAASGSVDGLGQMTLTDGATTNRSHVEWGIEENFNPSSPSPLLITSTSLDSSFQGTGNTRTGAFDPIGAGNTTLRASLSGVNVVVCGTGSQPHIGRWRIRPRVYQSGSGTCRVRLAWRVGKSDAFTNNPWVTLGTPGQWFEPDLGLVNIPTALIGTQSWEGWIQSYSSVAGDTLDVNYVQCMPAARFGKARGPITAEVASTFSVRDEFDQTAGNLNGKTPPVGGNWATTGATTDLAVEATGHTVQRATFSDSGGSGNFTGARYGIGSVSLTNQSVQLDLKFTNMQGGMIVGLVFRYTDTSNFGFLGILPVATSGSGAVCGGTSTSGGALSALSITPYSALWAQPSVWYTFRAQVDTDGNYAFYAAPTGSQFSTPLAVGNSSLFATGGTLASGKGGIFDQNTSGTAPTRNYDNFALWTPSVNPHVINSGKRLQIDYQSALREPTSGAAWGRVPTYEGSYIKVPPAGNESRVSRLVAKARSYDIDQSSSSAPAKFTLDLSSQPRVTLLG